MELSLAAETNKFHKDVFSHFVKAHAMRKRKAGGDYQHIQGSEVVV